MATRHFVYSHFIQECHFACEMTVDKKTRQNDCRQNEKANDCRQNKCNEITKDKITVYKKTVDKMTRQND